MKINLILYFLFIINLITISCEEKTLTKLDSLGGLEFGKKYTNITSKGKIDFEYSENLGTYCKVNKDLYNDEVTFSIPKEFIISSFDLFPFKYEITKALKLYFNQYRSKISQEDILRMVGTYHTVYNLMFLNYREKDKINECLKNNKYDHYIRNYTNKIKEDYIDSLPEYTYNIEKFSEKDKMLTNLLFLVKQEKVDISITLFEYVYKYMIEEFKKVSECFTPWMSDSKNFIHFLSLKRSRSYQLVLNQYEIVNKNILHNNPQWIDQKTKLLDIYKYHGNCMVPLFDLCNHQGLQNSNTSVIPFNLFPHVDYLKVVVSKQFTKGEEYFYSYKKITSNLNLLYDYGFYIEDNSDSFGLFSFYINKKNFSENKFQLAQKLKAFERFNLEKFEIYKDVKITYGMNKIELNQRAIMFYRILYLPENITSSNKKIDEIIYLLIVDNYFNYESEVKALVNYRHDVLKFYKNPKVKNEDILYSLHNTRLYYKENRENIRADSNLLFIYKLRRRIMQVGKEFRKIYLMNVKMAQDEIKKNVSKQFNQIRNYFIK